eukprot:TRINITY_DN12360_c0_g1::TRINITY_DN12360_c0_g1_i1::g.4915::m.4915 TRINITY_DN12360_c0_g1::TRINITY_DN12360_c0_g1_i1::g.4915  ORF type:complete len:308 (+),score=8.35,sp/Q9SUK9/P2C55_ARATH/36.40/2e-40,SpoIIE/PF07228.7/1.2e-07,PP2C_2/PF13672.1/1.6e-07,PP2C/PF00481.16/6.9,PP2C/PF00481.16/8e-05,FBA/PF04300.8/0.052 TRINITY_DN12360_c0_g1_i1:57-980(+)
MIFRSFALSSSLRAVHSSYIRANGPNISSIPRRWDVCSVRFPHSSASKIRMIAGVSVIPHPNKASRGGEDACFVIAEAGAAGVFDGVGGVALRSIDPSAYPRQLARFVSDEIVGKDPTDPFPRTRDPHQALVRGVERLTTQGACTACVFILDPPYLRYCNIGDSGLAVIRNKQMVFRTDPQQHKFDWPYQIGDQSRDDVKKDAVTGRKLLQEGDVVILASDGLWDNLFDDEIIKIVAEYSRNPVDDLANELAHNAYLATKDRNRVTPYSDAARKHNPQRDYNGGKADDIMVIAARIHTFGSDFDDFA